jgi:hypothetical protein
LNWEAIGAVGEVVGAAGVIASLVYLAVQIRHNTRSVEAATYQSVAESLADASYRLVGSASTPLDRLRIFVGTMRRYENLHFQVRRGNLHPSDVEGFVNSLGAYLHVPEDDGFEARALWESTRSIFHPEFVVFVEQEVLPRGAEFSEFSRQVIGSRSEPP